MLNGRALKERISVGDDFRSVVDSLPGLVWTALPDGNLQFLNQRWCEYTGITLDEARGQGWPTAVHPEDRLDLLDRWRSGTAFGGPWEVEACLRRFDGEFRHVEYPPRVLQINLQIAAWLRTADQSASFGRWLQWRGLIANRPPDQRALTGVTNARSARPSDGDIARLSEFQQAVKG